MLEFKQGAVRLVESGQSQAAAARNPGVVEQTKGNWAREHRTGMPNGATSKPVVSAKQMRLHHAKGMYCEWGTLSKVAA